jgi:hypothetical protein
MMKLATLFKRHTTAAIEQVSAVELADLRGQVNAIGRSRR